MTNRNNVNYNELEQHTYTDSRNNIFYTCPRCGGEYVDTFIIKEEGRKMCIDCRSKIYSED